MIIQPDFKELLQLLENHQVDYMVVGGYAVAFHGYPRFTKDLDIFYQATPQNISKLQEALVAFGFAQTDFEEASFEEPGTVISFGVPPTRVYLLNAIDGVSFAEASRNTVSVRYAGITATFISRKDLLKNKLATPRTRDKADAEELQSVEGTRSDSQS